jgi:sulfur-oxidizing protein SoxX
MVSRMMLPAMGVAVLVLGVLSIAPAVVAEEVVAYEIVDEVSIPKALTGSAGDPDRGRKIAVNRKQGNCLACHILPIPEESFHGETGPDLHGVASRYTAGELRLRIVNPKVVNPGTLMPAFYRNDGFHRVAKNFQGKTILDAQQVEDLVAYLMTLK